MSLKLGDLFPNFQLKTTIGNIQLHDWINDQFVSCQHVSLQTMFVLQYFRWAILFSHPADYTPVCTTELSRAAKLAPQFAKRNTKLIGLSCDSIENHQGWIKVTTTNYFRKTIDLFIYLFENVNKDIQSYLGSNVECIGDVCRLIPTTGEFPFPIIDDSDRTLAKQLGMIDPDEFDNKGLPLTARAVNSFFICFFVVLLIFSIRRYFSLDLIKK